ncbi:Aldehyde dehydrogenase [Gracilaria domingensis]|nr:Aldehyde dehydrogenase [Gracilaria domingensis]
MKPSALVPRSLIASLPVRLAHPLFTQLRPHTAQPSAAAPVEPPSVQTPSPDAHALIDPVVSLTRAWAAQSGDRGLAAKLADDESAVSFIMKFTDRVMRPENSTVAASILSKLIRSDGLPPFLTALDRLLMTAAVPIASVLPGPVMQSARLRMRQMVAPFVQIVDKVQFKQSSVSRNVNLLGEAVLGDVEAAHRLQEAIDLLKKPGVTYVSVKVSGVVSQLNPWDFEGSLHRVLVTLRPLFEQAVKSNPQVLINLDMEEYRDLDLTIAAFTTLLEQPEFQDLDAGIVLQAYLPDALPALQDLVTWANNRPGKGEIKVRLVKGANLAMEKVDAVMHGWQLATFDAKSETDANYLKCLDWVLTPENTARVRIGVASHNLFFLAYATLLAEQRGVSHRVGFENLQGMTPAHTPMLSTKGHGMLLYTPVCRVQDFDVAISYLFRRFEETSASGNFLRSMARFAPNTPEFQLEEQRFKTAVLKKQAVSVGARRSQERPAPASEMTLKGFHNSDQFINEPDTDPVLPSNREWAKKVIDASLFTPVSEDSVVETTSGIDNVYERARRAMRVWSKDAGTPGRRAVFTAIADELARNRGLLINAMMYEGLKIFGEADPEVSEAIDFATYYGMMGDHIPDNFEPLGVVCVAAPWNFPVAIPCGGVLAALAAGNAVILKPSPSTPRCAELLAECMWRAGVPKDVLQVVQAPENEVGKRLITNADGVILTGASETASMFRSWKNDIRLFAETSGKNSLIISSAADLDLAVADLVNSAFSNTGQRCSAASLAICVGDVYNSDRFRRQLADAARSLKVGPPNDISTNMGPLIHPPEEKLRRALTTLEDGESWLVEPRCLDAEGEGQLWTPGVRMGVKPGSWFHQTEVFGPVLGVMSAKDLDEAIAMQNGNKYGLTGGIHSLDPDEIEQWKDNVQVGNAYINRGITGAIVQRQSFGGWKASVVGPGAKAGGPNYINQFGHIRDDELRSESWLAKAVVADEKAWEYFCAEHDPSGLEFETNVLRYKPLDRIAIRISPNANEYEIRRVKAAVDLVGLPVVWSREESASEFASRLSSLDVNRVRIVGEGENEVLAAAAQHGIHIADQQVVGDGRTELLHYLREQAENHEDETTDLIPRKMTGNLTNEEELGIKPDVVSSSDKTGELHGPLTHKKYERMLLTYCISSSLPNLCS